MIYTSPYYSPLGEITLSADEQGLIGAWFVGQKHYGSTLIGDTRQTTNQHIENAKLWLKEYFNQKIPQTKIELHPIGTPFQMEVWNILTKIPFGDTITYGDISKLIAQKRKLKQMSSQAVGNAVGHNPISIIIPCHRVIGTNGKLCGYAGGIERKQTLLKIEKTAKTE